MSHPKPECSRVVRFLSDYLEKHLDSRVREALEAHLRRCPACVTQLRTYESTVSLLKTLKDDDLPPDLRLTVKAFLDQKCQNN